MVDHVYVYVGTLLKYIRYIYHTLSLCVVLTILLMIQLAVGMDKARNDSSLIVWDTTRASSSETTPLDRTRYIILVTIVT